VALHFEPDEFESRRTHVLEEMARRRLDAMLLFAPESHYC
jgi:Xaa-Pro dipeptidase